MPHYEADDENDGASLTDTTQKEVIQWLFFGGVLFMILFGLIVMSFLRAIFFPDAEDSQASQD